MNLEFDKNGQITIKREDLKNDIFDIGGRDIIIGFNEPAFKSSQKDELPDLDSKLNARFITYFLPAVEVAKAQKRRPRLMLVSGLNIALKWNAHTENEKKIMMINNNLKFDFLKEFFNYFFPESFSIIECIVAQDPIKINEDKILELWKMIEEKYPDEIRQIKLELARFKNPKLFNGSVLSDEAEVYLKEQESDLFSSYKYAIAHIMVLGDINFEGNYIHNPIGYLSIGGQQEKTFNIIRKCATEVLKKDVLNIFDRSIIHKDNLKLITENKEKTPPPYNGYYRKNGDRTFLDEVTYENGLSLDFYDEHKKLKYEMEYMYENLVSKQAYKDFWTNYQSRYFDLKNRYKEAYNLDIDF